MRARIVIIGGGVIGVCTALHAAQKTDGLREPVMLLEKGRVGGGASGSSTAVLRQFYSSPCTARMARDSLRYFSSLEGRTSRSVGFTRSGVLTLARSRSAEEIARLERIVEMMGSVGIDVHVLGADEIRERIPGILVHDDTVGAWEPTAGFVDSARTLDALATLARDRGAVVRTGSAVERVLVEGGRVVGVRTATGEIDCEQVVIAAGSRALTILAELGVEMPLRVVRTDHLHVGHPVEVSPERLEESLLAASGPEDSGATAWYSRELIEEAQAERARSTSLRGGALLPPPSHPVLIDPELGFYAKCDPLRNGSQVGRFDYGESVELSDLDGVLEAAGPTFHRWARQVLEARLPFYRDVPGCGGSASVFTVTPDAQAVIGPVPEIEGLFVACGFSGHGFKLAPSVGEGLAQLLVGESVSAFDPEFFDPARFSKGEPVEPPIPFGG